jgi:hypothetical protein
MARYMVSSTTEHSSGRLGSLTGMLVTSCNPSVSRASLSPVWAGCSARMRSAASGRATGWVSAVALEHRHAGEHLVQDRPRGEHVALGPHLAPLHVLRGHVAGAADELGVPVALVTRVRVTLSAISVPVFDANAILQIPTCPSYPSRSVFRLPRARPRTRGLRFANPPSGLWNPIVGLEAGEWEAWVLASSTQGAYRFPSAGRTACRSAPPYSDRAATGRKCRPLRTRETVDLIRSGCDTVPEGLYDDPFPLPGRAPGRE